MQITYTEYLDRVYGCWLGKCISGTIGAPYEGAKELFDFAYDPAMIASMLPNDDLDLQVLWLDVLEQKGVNFTTLDLAKSFAELCPYAPGEYATFRRNYRLGIMPPMSGLFNNYYYREGNGCPIRSEIWACVAPGNPMLAAELASKDGIMDHAGNSVYGERFLAAVEAAAFFEHDLDKLFEIGLSVVPQDCKLRRVVTDTLGWCKSESCWQQVRGHIIRHYGHPDCTNSIQNFGFALMSLKFGNMDFMDTTMIALNAGYDTDCTCATAGSILGIIQGASSLQAQYNLQDPGYVLGVNVTRRSDRLLHLSEDTCMVGLHFAEHTNKQVKITNAPAAPQIKLMAPAVVECETQYETLPSIGLGETRRVQIKITNRLSARSTAQLSLSIPEGWSSDWQQQELTLVPNQAAYVSIDLSVPTSLPKMVQTNIIKLAIHTEDGAEFKHQFGMNGAAIWAAYGPFWVNNADMSQLKPGESYYAHIKGSGEQDIIDQVRCYHLNARVDLDVMELDPLKIASELNFDTMDVAKRAMRVNIHEDLFRVGDVMSYQGPCALIMTQQFDCPEEREVGIALGHTDAYRLWLNGVEVSRRDNVDWWTVENAHIIKQKLLKGRNTLVWRISRRAQEAQFSLQFLNGTACADVYNDFTFINPFAE
ncbi:MAG: ADP-ribosylglycohydrolase family protein [Armatimonadota bacterium]